MVQVDVTNEALHGIPAGVRLTPMMRQYVAAKAEYPDALLFFRMGDFYEMFYEDAELGGRHLDLTVTSRDKDSSVPAPMSGFPHHQLPAYLSKALAAGLKVAVCDQLEDPSLARGIVRRGITRVVTPGVVLDAESLDARANNHLVGVVSCGDGERFALAALDVSTGEFRATEVIGRSALRCELARLEPREIVVSDADEPKLRASAAERMAGIARSRPPGGAIAAAAAAEALARLCGPDGEPAVEALRAFGFGAAEAVICAAGTVAAYVSDTQRGLPDHARLVVPYRVHETLILDETAKSNLELFRTQMDGRRKGALLGTLDRAVTAMGGRRLRQWLGAPLVDPARVGVRLDAVEHLVQRADVRGRLRAALQPMYDLERLNGRVAAGSATPRDLWCLRLTLERVPAARAELEGAAAFASILGRIDPLADLTALLAAALADEPPVAVKDGGVIRAGYDPELDELTALATTGKDWLTDLEARERARTGVTSLKVRYNRVFGYYIEISKANLHLVPAEYIRKQTLANAERYFTEELKEFEDKVLNAESRREAREAELFAALRAEVAGNAARVGETASALADLDALAGLAEVAHRNGYCRPIVDDGETIEIEEGRHPVVEESVGREHFVPNSVRLDRAERMLVLTGPNMAGKSTIMRQVALITVMAQMGSFVPARAARIGVVDRVFTRVGAADDLAAGRSTFMVEMHETAAILSEASARSLLILDEIGRGTSTHDGISIAWAVAEHLHDVVGAKALFATHYHELTELAEHKPRVRNFTIAVKEWNDEVVFLRQLVPGAASRSYGIQVARLAGLPRAVVERAKVILNALQTSELTASGAARFSAPVGVEGETPTNANWQLSLFAPPPIPAAPSVVERELRAADLDAMSPLQAMNFLHALRARLR